MSWDWDDPDALAALGQMLGSAERRIKTERSRKVVSWTAKDHRELNRLLKKATLCVGGPDIGALLSVAALHVAAEKDPNRLQFDELGLSYNIGPWCAWVERHFGKRRHPAIRWLVEQYEKKEDRETFKRIFGGGSNDSRARRIYQKALATGEFERADLISAASRDLLVRFPSNDLYELTFKQWQRWPEPGLLTEIYWLVQHRQYLDKEESEIFHEVFGAPNAKTGAYTLWRNATQRVPQNVKRGAALEYWSGFKTRVQKRHQKTKSQSGPDRSM